MINDVTQTDTCQNDTSQYDTCQDDTSQYDTSQNDIYKSQNDVGIIMISKE